MPLRGTLFGFLLLSLPALAETLTGPGGDVHDGDTLTLRVNGLQEVKAGRH